MKISRIRRRTLPGAAPGTLTADPHGLRPTVQVAAYGPDYLHEQKVEQLEELKAFMGRYQVTWVNVVGLGDIDLIRQLGEMFGLHDLALEDVIHVHQRPKVEEYDDHVFIITRTPINAGETFETKQVALFMGDNFVLSFQESANQCFEPVCNRMRRKRGRLRNASADYLTYALLDAVLDDYFPMLDKYGETIEELETRLLERFENSLVTRVHQIKRDLLTMRRAIWPQRDMLNILIREDSLLVHDQTRIYLRDCYDHAIQLIDLVETYREIASGLVDLYLSSLSTRMNEVMKVLTIMSTLFIPLGFIAGVYGMNFDPKKSPWNMPELSWYFGYPFALALMGAVALGFIVYFRHKGWLGKR
jgi:magnesium transporter